MSNIFYVKYILCQIYFMSNSVVLKIYLKFAKSFLSKHKNCITTSHFYGILCDQNVCLQFF